MKRRNPGIDFTDSVFHPGYETMKLFESISRKPERTKAKRRKVK